MRCTTLSNNDNLNPDTPRETETSDRQSEFPTTAMICWSERPKTTSTASLSFLTGRASFW